MSEKLRTHQIDSRLRKMTSIEEIEEFIKDYPSKNVRQLADYRIGQIRKAAATPAMKVDPKALQPDPPPPADDHVPEAGEMADADPEPAAEPEAPGTTDAEPVGPSAQVIAITPGAGEQPLDQTTRPATAKEAKEIRDAAAANRPFQEPPPKINPPIIPKNARELAIAAQLKEAFDEAIDDRIGSIMAGFDDSFALSGNDKKYTYNVGAACRIIGLENNNFDVSVELTWTVKEKVKIEKSVHMENPEGDIVDRANKIERERKAAASAPPPAADALAAGFVPPRDRKRDATMMALNNDEIHAIINNPDVDPDEKQAAIDELELRKSTEMGKGQPTGGMIPKKRGRPKKDAATA